MVKKKKDYSVVGMLGILIGGFLLGMVFQDIYGNWTFVFPSEVENLSDVELASKEYTKNVSEFYNYTLANIHKRLSESELRENGGVCWHYADYYVKLASFDGFKAKKLIFPTSNNSSHAVTAIANKEGYCILSNDLILGCGKFGNGET